MEHNKHKGIGEMPAWIEDNQNDEYEEQQVIGNMANESVTKIQIS